MSSIQDRKGKPISPKGNDAPMTDMEVRIFLRDTDPDANILIDDLVESSVFKLHSFHNFGINLLDMVVTVLVR